MIERIYTQNNMRRAITFYRGKSDLSIKELSETALIGENILKNMELGHEEITIEEFVHIMCALDAPWSVFDLVDE